MIVLLKLERMCATPCRTLRLGLDFCFAAGFLAITLLRYLLFACDRLFRAFSRASVAPRALTPSGQPFPVPNPAVASDFDQPTDVLLNLALQVALDGEIPINHLSQMRHIGIRKVAGFYVGVNSCPLADVHRRFAADAIKIRQSENDFFVSWKVNACDSRHAVLLPLSLPLLVLRIRAQNPHDALALDNFALIAHFSDAGTHLHIVFAYTKTRHARAGQHQAPTPEQTRRSVYPQTRPHLNRYTIRPRVRSYGDSSTFTLSPGSIRI